ncbi:MAG: winged helix-turn-helix transcriptional regulator [Clostridia bacterium]|nr:winged helix-turn-helix transcriptional regulator [Clostridia bacterium]
MMNGFVSPNKDEIDELIYLKGSILRIGLNKLGLYVGQPLMLDIVTSNPGLNQKILAKLAGIKPSTVNVMLNRMAKNDLVEIKKNEKNSKLSQVFATNKGKELHEKSMQFKQKLDKIAYKDLSRDEIETFKNILSKINNNFKEELEKEEASK